MINQNYYLPAAVIQAVVNTLNELPAVKVRGLLNTIEATCAAQDEKAGKAQLKEQIDAALAAMTKEDTTKGNKP